MLAVVDGALALNRQRDPASGIEGFGHFDLVDDTGHREGVVAGDEGHVVDGCVADNAGFEGGEDEGYVAQGNSDHGWIGDVCEALEIWLAGFGGAVEADIGDVETFQAIETFVCAGGVEVDVNGWELPLMQVGPSGQCRGNVFLRDNRRSIVGDLLEVCNLQVQILNTGIGYWV